MKKITAIILALLTVALLASCGANKTAYSTKTADGKYTFGEVTPVCEDGFLPLNGLKIKGSEHTEEKEFSMTDVLSDFKAGEEIEIFFDTELDVDTDGAQINIFCKKHEDIESYTERNMLNVGYTSLDEGFVIRDVDTDDGDASRIASVKLSEDMEPGEYDFLVYYMLELYYYMPIQITD